MAASAGATGSGAASSSATASPFRASANVPPAVEKASGSSVAIADCASRLASIVLSVILASTCWAARAKSSASAASSQTVNQASGASGTAAPPSATDAAGVGA